MVNMRFLDRKAPDKNDISRDEEYLKFATTLRYEPSIASTTSKKSSLSRYSSIFGGSRRSSVTSYNSFASQSSAADDVPRLIKTPWEQDRSLRPVSRRPSKLLKPPPVLPARFFQTLPKEIYACIVRQLEILHLASDRKTCPTCYLRDLCSLFLTSRRFNHAATDQLYGTLWITAEADRHVTKRNTTSNLDRLRFLRRTLRDHPSLAKAVRTLEFWDWKPIWDKANPQGRREIEDNLASIVMACPRLERCRGFHAEYDHDFNRLNHALSTRPALKERVWIIRGDPAQWEQIMDEQTQSDYEDYCLPDPREAYADSFLQHHHNWNALDTLAIFGRQKSGMTYRAFVGAFRHLPSLKHLLISNFDAEEFNDRTLQAVPVLWSLRLEDLSGVTDKGIVKFANSPAAKALETLALINIEVLRLHVLARLLSNCQSLRKFTLIQTSNPGLLPGAVMPSPVYASESLQFLHWDVLIPGSANEDMASSIAAGAFPSLRTVRAPNDDDGLLQSQCRPLDRFSQSSDSQLVNRNYGSNNVDSTRGLAHARRAAEGRILNPLQPAFFKIYVEEDGVIKHTYTLRVPVGSKVSGIEYMLDPDIEGSDDAVASLDDLLGESREHWNGETCVGRWNYRNLVQGQTHSLRQLPARVTIRDFF
ncbi:hypothetical protein K402DRAFT_360674 [Aulographum hederae CBS 113979]|uniref:F-box domain-containing protein n=1 Tax=Aulographum hederae CBS 113979 TaxID=1176131 RepID=A0A6G1GSC8_9PEZI|nr:hypothetical protein K402DRAFT_360674 [Aulographum hederae CBS 113979]